MTTRRCFRSLVPTMLVTACLASTLTAQSGPSLEIMPSEGSVADSARIRLFSFDSLGHVQGSLSAGEIEIREDGRLVESVSIAVADAEPTPVSSVISIDRATSTFGASRALMRRFVATWGALEASGSTTTLLSFSEWSSFEVESAADTLSLLRAFDGITAKSTTSYGVALLGPPAGLIDVASRGVRRRIAILIVDGHGYDFPNAAIDSALANDVAVFIVGVGVPVPSTLKLLAERSGGASFDRIESFEQVERAARVASALAHAVAPLIVSWEPLPGCAGLRTVTAGVAGARDTASLTIPAHLVGHLALPPVRFAPAVPGSVLRQTVSLRNVGRHSRLDSITSNDPRVTAEIAGMALPAWIDSGASRDVSVQLDQRDLSYVMATVSFWSEGCATDLEVVGGSPRMEPIVPTLRVDVSVAGELTAGDSVTLSWSGLGTGDTTVVEWRDVDDDWHQLARTHGAGSTRWRIPIDVDDSLFIRARQVRPGRFGSDTIRIGTAQSWLPDLIEFHPSGEEYLILNNPYDSLFTRDATTGERRVYLSGTQYAVAAAYHPRGEVIAIADIPDIRALVRIFSVRSGLPIDTLEGTPTWPEPHSLEYNSDGSLLAAVRGREITVYDPASTAGKRTFTAIDSVHDIAFAASLTEIVSAEASIDTSRGGVRVWDATTGVLVRTIHEASGATAVSVSPDGRYIGAEVRGAAMIWTRAGSPVTTLPRAALPIFSADGRHYAVYSYAGKVLEVRRLVDHAVVTTLEQHGRMAEYVFNPDGARMLLSHYQQLAAVWNWNDAPLQTATRSLGVARSRPSITPIDLGHVPAPGRREIPIPNWLTNVGDGAMRVRDLRISSQDSREFELVSGIAPFEVAPGASAPVEIRFRPRAIGLRTATIVVVTQSDTVRAAITGIGDDPADIDLSETRPADLSIAPPCNAYVDIHRDGFAVLTIVDVRGDARARPLNAVVSRGRYRFDMDRLGLPPGVYFATLETGGHRSTLMFALPGE